MSASPHADAIAGLWGAFVALFLPAVLLGVALYWASNAQVGGLSLATWDAVARQEWDFSQSMSIIGSAPAWNLVLSWLPPQLDPLAATWWPLVLYRLLLAAIVAVMVLPTSYAAFVVGQHHASRMFAQARATQNNRAVWARGCFVLSASIPALLAVLPCCVYAPITLPVIMFGTLVPSAWWFGCHVPFKV